MLSHVQLFAIWWTVARQAPLSMGFFQQEYWSGLPFPPPGALSNPGIEPTSPVSPALAGGCFTTDPQGKPSEREWMFISESPLPQACAGTLLLLLSRFSHVQLCATPQTAAHQAPPSLGFSRQEHWSGLPFPSPMHERLALYWGWKTPRLSFLTSGIRLSYCPCQVPIASHEDRCCPSPHYIWNHAFAMETCKLSKWEDWHVYGTWHKVRAKSMLVKLNWSLYALCHHIQFFLIKYMPVSLLNCLWYSPTQNVGVSKLFW